jgi:DNA mismatch endonuclease, patch repair protein
MADVHDAQTRQANMSAIRGKNTRPEIVVRKLIFAKGLRYRLHVKSLPGVPDIVLSKHRVAIMVNGCFWHGHGCYLFKLPGTRTEFWAKKIQGNIDRDRRDIASLNAAGWRVLCIWECAIKGRLRWDHANLAENIATWIRTGVREKNVEIAHIGFQSPGQIS